MREYIVLIMLSLCSIGVSAQSEAMTVDNQMPGWLSSKIAYTDQVSLKSLKVTGYINGTDLAFVKKLMKNKSLVHVDLSDANIVSGGGVKDNEVSYGFYFQEQKQGTYLSLPVNAEVINNFYRNGPSGFDEPGNNVIDTLVLGGPSYKSFTLYRQHHFLANYLYLREGVDTLDTYSALSVKKIHLPSTVRYLPRNAFVKREESYGETTDEIDINLTDAIEGIARTAFRDLYLKGDTIRLPSGMKVWYTSSFLIRKEGTVIHIPAGLTVIDNESDRYGNREQIESDKHIHFFMESAVPPEFTRRYSGGRELSGCVVHVPQGSKSNYEKAEYWKYATIIEEIPVKGVSIGKPEECVYVGDRFKPDVAIVPENALNRNYTLKSLDERVAALDDEGFVVLKSYGKARIQATTEDGGYTDVCEFDVYEHTVGIRLETEQARVRKGGRLTLAAVAQPEGKTDGRLVWSSSDGSVASVDEEGVVSGKSKGEAVITVTAVDGGYTAECRVRVYQPVTELRMDNRSVTVDTGDDIQLTATILPYDADNKSIVWSSDNPDVADVNGKGVVTGVKAGQTVIRATSEDEGISDFCVVTVNQPVTGVSLSKSELSFSKIGDAEQLVANVQPADATNKELNWSSSDESVAIVSNGRVLCSGYGSAIVYVTTVDGGYMASCVVKADDGLTGIDGVAADGSVSVDNGRLVLKGIPEGMRILVTDISGQVVCSLKGDGTALTTLPDLGKGVFVVKIGNKSCRVVL
ncbi:Ig-like domain-containing protein [Leyella lascolaii]|uniref:Ig-like domain-containing protein n=1 Tax=Leyella lascolaii TaxID=1776379 RepID=UPI0029429780|nr:Ig-like domain-containing protein [Leyella lascolaii]